jgi:hypothetical protein
MKTTNRITQFTVTLACLSSLMSISSPPASLAQGKTTRTQERIGVYDSRAIAVAYVGSTHQSDKMKDLQAQFATAKKSGDAKEVARLEAEGKAWQARLHQQGFGTAPVDDILAHIANELPKVREAAGVSRFISKWDQAELSKYSKSAQVEVTMSLVDAFHPDPAQRKRAIEIQKLRPEKTKD